MRLKLLSYNIHKGFSAFNRKLILEQMREGIRAVGADLVFLQEVRGSHRVTDDLHQLEYLADQSWHHFAYAKNAIYQEGHHGNAILSKFGFESWSNLNLSTSALASRSLLYGKIKYSESPSKELFIACIHLGLFEQERLRQAESIFHELLEQIKHDEPIIVAGDFNDWRGSVHEFLTTHLKFSEAHVSTHGALAKTFPSLWPTLRMDRIYTRNLKVIDATTLSGEPWNALSDHVPLFAEVELPTSGS